MQTLFSILHLKNKYDLNTIFLVKLKIYKCPLHYGAATIKTFLKGASNKKTLGNTGLYDAFATVSFFNYTSSQSRAEHFFTESYFPAIPVAGVVLLLIIVVLAGMVRRRKNSGSAAVAKKSDHLELQNRKNSGN